LALQAASLLGEVGTPLRQFGQADRAGLVGIEQAFVGSGGAVQASAELLIGGAVTGRPSLGCGGEPFELRQQALRIGEQARDVIPDNGLKLLRLDVAAWAGSWASGQDAVLSVAQVDPPLGLIGGCPIGATEHGEATDLAGEQATQEIIVLAVVPEREGGVARELCLRPVPSIRIDQRRHGNRNPLLARLELAAGGFVATRTAVTPRLPGRHIVIAIGVGGAGVDRIGEDVMHDRWPPGMPARARVVRSSIEPLEHLANGHLFIDEPVVEHTHHLRLGVINDEVAGDSIVARHVAIAVRGAATEVMPITRLLQLAAAKPLTQHGALIFGDGALDLQQQLVIWVIGNRMLQECHLAASTAELLKQQDLVSIAPRQTIRAQHHDELDGTVTDHVAQGVEAGSIEPRAAVALVAEDVLLRKLVSFSPDPAPQSGELAVDGLLALLALGRDAGIEGGAHGGLASA
jgi:hypothetical protein